MKRMEKKIDSVTQSPLIVRAWPSDRSGAIVVLNPASLANLNDSCRDYTESIRLVIRRLGYSIVMKLDTLKVRAYT